MKKYYKKILNVLLLAMILLSASVPSITALENIPVQESVVMDENEKIMGETDEGTLESVNEKNIENDFLEENSSKNKESNSPPVDMTKPGMDSGEPIIIATLKDYDFYVKDKHVYDEFEDGVNPYVFVTPDILNQVDERHQKSRASGNSYPITRYTNAQYGVEGREVFYTGPYSAWGEWGIFKIDGVWAFCIEHDKFIDDVVTESSSNRYSGFNQNLRDNIDAISGYGMKLYSDTNDMKYLFAAQMMIWDAIDPDFWSANKGSLANYGKEIDDYTSDYRTRPSFMQFTQETPPIHTAKWNTSTNRYEVKLTDTNGVYDYKVGNNLNLPTGWNQTRNGNTVTLHTTNHSMQPQTVTSDSYKPYNGDTRLFTGGQDTVSAMPDPQTFHMKLKIEPAPVKIYVSKVDSESGAEVPGAEICITNTATGDENCFTSTDKPTLIELLPGTYEVCETLAPPGYVINTECDTVTVTPGDEDIDLEIVNKPIKGGFELSKVGDTGLLYPLAPNTPLANVEFTLTGESLYGPITKVYKTDVDGKIKTTNSELFYGDYNLCETNTITGYINPANCYKFKIDVDGEIELINNLASIINEAIVGSGELVKVGESLDNHSEEVVGLEGAEFTITQTNNNNVVVRKVYSDKNGLVKTGPLVYGDYQICETKPPYGYNVEEGFWTASYCENFSIRTDGEIVKLKGHQNNEVYNDIIEGGITLNKHGETYLPNSDAEVNLQGGEFSIYDTDGDSDTVLGEPEDHFNTDLNGDGIMDADYVDKMITDKKGYAEYENLDAGKGRTIETKSPIGYSTTPNFEEDFEIDYDGEIITMNKGDEIWNELIVGNMELTKLGLPFTNPNFEDCGNNVKPEDCVVWEYVPLEGAEFEVYWIDQDGNANGLADEENTQLPLEPVYDRDLNGDGIMDAIYIDTVVTDENGYAMLPNLKYGKYMVRETKAPEGYINTGFEEIFYINQQGETVTISGGVDYNGEECINGVCNDVIMGQADLIKMGDYAYTDEGVIINPRLGGSRWMVYEDRGEIGALDSRDIPLQTMTTDEMGYAITNTLRYNTYLAQEIEAPEGYTLTGDEIYSFEIRKDGEIVHINGGKPIINIADVPDCGNPNYPEMPNNPDFPACNPEIEAEKNVFDYNGDGFVQAGEQLTYAISVKNKGLGFAKNVNVQDDVVTQLEKYIDFDSETLNQILEIETITMDRPQIELPIEVDPKPSETLIKGNTLTNDTDIVEWLYFTSEGDKPVTVEFTYTNEEGNSASHTEVVNPGEYSRIGFGNGYSIKAIDGTILGYKFMPESNISSGPVYINVQDRTKYTLLDLISGDVFVDIPSYMEANISFTVRAKDPLPDMGSNNGSLVCGELGNVAWITEDPTPTDPTDPMPEEPNHKPEVEIPVECRDPEVESKKTNIDESGNGILESGEKVTYTIAVKNISDVFAGGVIVGDAVKEQLATNFDLNESTMNQELKITTVIYDQDKYLDYNTADSDFKVPNEGDIDVSLLPDITQENYLLQDKTVYTLNDLNNSKVIVDIPVGHEVEISFDVFAKKPLVNTCSQIINIATIDPTPNNPDDENQKPESEIPTYCLPGEIKDTGISNTIIIALSLFLILAICLIKQFNINTK